MRSLLVLAIAAPLALAGPGPTGTAKVPGPAPAPRLSPDDVKYLEDLLRECLFDPKGAIRVQVKVPSRNSRAYVWTPDWSHQRDGWLVRGKEPRVYFADGESVPAPPPARMRPVSFLALCQRRYPADPDAHRDRLARSLDPDDSDIAWAAWLHRLGHDDLAARALAAARARDANCDPREVLRRDLARRAADEMLDAFCRRADADAQSHGGRLFCLYPDLTQDFPHAESILADLARRERDGTFGLTPRAGFPPWFALWDPRKKLDHLIASLDQIDEERHHELGTGPVEDRRYAALVGLGELAVPALLDVIEKDTRLTRMAERDRGEPTGRMITVRERAEDAVREILRVRTFDPTGDLPGSGQGARLARMRRYWETYGRLPPDERMMRILTDPRAARDACVEAAAHVTALYDRGPERWDRAGTSFARRPVNPAATKFQRPTAAEAILAAMDRGRSTLDDSDRDASLRAEDHYLDCLVALGDRRVAAELSRRAGEIADAHRRRLYAVAAHQLGASGAWIALVRDFERGTLALARRPDGEPDPDHAHRELASYLDDLDDHRGPDADRALTALADPAHPVRPVLLDAMLDHGRHSRPDDVWYRHPACLTVLRRALDDTTATGRHFYLRGDEIEEMTSARADRSPLPADRRDPAGWAEHAEERTCDVAAERVTDLVAGVPPRHALRRDAEPSLAALRTFLARHRFRRLTESEVRRLDWRTSDPGYIPDIRPLGRPATAADVAAGRAVFHLNGKGKPAADPPVWVALKGDLDAHRSAEKEIPKVAAGTPPASDVDPLAVGLVVQAEVGPGGKVYYGVIFRTAIRVVRADEVEPAPRR